MGYVTGTLTRGEVMEKRVKIRRGDIGREVMPDIPDVVVGRHAWSVRDMFLDRGRPETVSYMESGGVTEYEFVVGPSRDRVKAVLQCSACGVCVEVEHVVAEDVRWGDRWMGLEGVMHDKATEKTGPCRERHGPIDRWWCGL